MSYIADLHIHSRFARACSDKLNIPNLSLWAKYKGINLLGTGDFLHPLWLGELKNTLVEDGSGFLVDPKSSIKYLLTVEIASIYTHKSKGRRIHNLIFLPDFESVAKFEKALLNKRATLGADGRPIVGTSSHDLLYLALEANEKAIMIPAHAWTPWFGVYGSMSGYDSLKDCFEDLSDYIYAIETGLSSDPAMNWRVDELDSRSIVSFSDAHSLPNLGREVSVFSNAIQDGYEGLFNSLKKQRIDKTLEFYPEEGKYHYTGHRKCGIKYTPEMTKAKGIICPVCGRNLTEGVMERVSTVANREESELKIKKVNGQIISEAFPKRAGYQMSVPLNQIISESFKVAKTSKKVEAEYKKLVLNLGGEIDILTKVDFSEIAKISGPKIAEGVDKNRKGELLIDPGYDGVYGVVSLWGKGDNQKKIPQMSIFD
jgi:uncharacterized protein (TIGR00375 family)